MDNIQNLHKKANRLLDANQVGGALVTILEMLKSVGLYSLVDKAAAIGETYKYMTRYLLDGVEDSDRTKLLGEMRGKLRLLADTALLHKKGVDSPDYFYSVWRFNRLRKESISAILDSYGNISSQLALADAAGNDATALRKQREELLERLFNTLLTSLGAGNDYADLSRYLSSGYADESVAAQSLSALTLSLLFFYDGAKMNLLLDVYDSSDADAVKAKALVGLVLAMIPNRDRILEDARLMARLSLWNDSLEAYTRLHEVVRVIIGTRDTERVTSKLKDEVLPELMKLRPEIMKTLGEKKDLDAAMLEDNPEWEELLGKSGLDKKMQELSEMQSEGADVMMVTFSNLKQFPFFNKASNWFLPFDARHTEINLAPEIAKMIEMLRSLGAMACDSDLYSLALASRQIPAAQRDMMSSQISANFDQLSEQTKVDVPQSSPQFNKEVLKSVRDLYRFFKLFRKREGFFDPFRSPLQFLELPVVGEMMNDNEVLRLFGEFYFKRGYYNEALPLLLKLSRDVTDDATIWEKIGFCYQSMQLFEEARNAYEKGALLKTPGPWLANKLAYVNRRLGNYSEAAELYARCMEMDPENVNLIMNAGNMLLETGDVAGALSHFYHANYLSPENPRMMRAVAWVELLNGNVEKSADYYQRVIALDPKASDYLNAGHVEAVKKNFKEALNYYKLSAEAGSADFAAAFKADMPAVEGLGVDRTTLQILLDLTLS